MKARAVECLAGGPVGTTLAPCSGWVAPRAFPSPHTAPGGVLTPATAAPATCTAATFNDCVTQLAGRTSPTLSILINRRIHVICPKDPSWAASVNCADNHKWPVLQDIGQLACIVRSCRDITIRTAVGPAERAFRLRDSGGGMVSNAPADGRQPGSRNSGGKKKERRPMLAMRGRVSVAPMGRDSYKHGSGSGLICPVRPQ